MKKLKVSEYDEDNEMVLMTVRIPKKDLEFVKTEAKELGYKSLGGFIRALINTYKK